MRGRLLNLALIAVAGLLAVPLPAHAGPGPTTCPATGAVCIDESVEGATPTITAPSGFQSSIVQVAVAVGEEWFVTITAPFDVNGTATITSFGLLEPGSQALSDAIAKLTAFFTRNPNIIGFSFDLFSDNDFGQIGIADIGPTVATGLSNRCQTVLLQLIS